MKRRLAIVSIAFITLIWANNSSLLVRLDQPGPARYLAHRGVHQIYAGKSLTNDTCTANPILQPSHSFIENTIPSMQAAFDVGADVVELDVHLTPDRTFAVFHDWRLECRTDGEGVTEETPMAKLRALDAGYGYSADGKTFPFRGMGIGLLPTLNEVFEAFPNGSFLINFKSQRADEGEALAQMLIDDPSLRSRVFGVYGGQIPTDVVLASVPGLRGFSKASMIRCFWQYEAIGWLGIVPQACRDTIVAVPINYAPFLWGWPDRFQQRMADAGSEVVIAGPFGGGFGSGIDTPALAAEVPDGFSGLVWTNRIEEINRITE